MTIRVLVCDDHQIVRQGIKQILGDAPDIDLAGEAATGPEAVARVRGGGIDVVLLDIAMPQRDGLDVLKQLKAEFARLPVLMLSTYPDRQYAVRSLKLGAAGYLNKSADSEQMIDAIRKVARGGLFVTPAVAELLAGALHAAPGADDEPLHERLSHREFQVFRLLSQGRSVGEIAAALVLAPNTVSTYRARILEKTGARNDVELALLAVRHEVAGGTDAPARTPGPPGAAGPAL
ncbi:MAG: response regulator transcription factor [Rubrivivax sp.]|nr:response regulator transcription factor [Rubrivivax sp.]